MTTQQIEVRTQRIAALLASAGDAEAAAKIIKYDTTDDLRFLNHIAKWRDSNKPITWARIKEVITLAQANAEFDALVLTADTYAKFDEVYDKLTTKRGSVLKLNTDRGLPACLLDMKTMRALVGTKGEYILDDGKSNSIKIAYNAKAANALGTGASWCTRHGSYSSYNTSPLIIVKDGGTMFQFYMRSIHKHQGVLTWYQTNNNLDNMFVVCNQQNTGYNFNGLTKTALSENAETRYPMLRRLLARLSHSAITEIPSWDSITIIANITRNLSWVQKNDKFDDLYDLILSEFTNEELIKLATDINWDSKDSNRMNTIVRVIRAIERRTNTEVVDIKSRMLEPAIKSGNPFNLIPVGIDVKDDNFNELVMQTIVSDPGNRWSNLNELIQYHVERPTTIGLAYIDKLAGETGAAIEQIIANINMSILERTLPHLQTTTLDPTETIVEWLSELHRHRDTLLVTDEKYVDLDRMLPFMVEAAKAISDKPSSYHANRANYKFRTILTLGISRNHPIAHQLKHVLETNLVKRPDFGNVANAKMSYVQHMLNNLETLPYFRTKLDEYFSADLLPFAALQTKAELLYLISEGELDPDYSWWKNLVLSSIHKSQTDMTTYVALSLLYQIDKVLNTNDFKTIASLFMNDIQINDFINQL